MVTKKRDVSKSVCAVIGGAGFLGSHLVQHLLGRECHVIVVDNLSAGRREYVNPASQFIHADITTSESFLYRLFQNNGVEYVFNYAAHPYIPLSFERPSHVFNTNATGAINVINAGHDAGVKGILQVSSAEIYGEGMRTTGYRATSKDEWGEDLASKLSEEAVVVPHSTYGASKAAVDAYVQCAWKERKTPVIALRQFNCVGPRETHPYVIPEIISQLYRNDSRNGGITVRLGNNSKRDFLFAGDAVRLATELIEYGDFGEVYNLGSETAVPIYSLPQTLSNIIGCGKVYVEEDRLRKRPWEIWHLQSDNTKIYRTIPGRPAVCLEDALELTVSHFVSVGKKWCWEK